MVLYVVNPKALPHFIPLPERDSNRPSGTTADGSRPSSHCGRLWTVRSRNPTPMGGAGEPAPEIGGTGGRSAGVRGRVGPPVFGMRSRTTEAVGRQDSTPMPEERLDPFKGSPERGRVKGRGLNRDLQGAGNRGGFEGGGGAPPRQSANVLHRPGWLRHLSVPEPACGRPPSRLSGHRPEQRPPGRRGQAPRPLGRQPPDGDGGHSLATAALHPASPRSALPVPLGDR